MSDTIKSEANHMPILRITGASGWYERDGWKEWLNSPRTATWHIAGRDPDGYSDVFFQMSGDIGCEDFDGSDAPGYGEPAVPEDIWNFIGKIAQSHFGERFECLVWISNCENS